MSRAATQPKKSSGTKDTSESSKSSPRKRTWLSGAVRREEILASAIKVFASKSYQGTTVRDIAKEAGVSEALLYKYFPSKKALFLEAFERSNKFLFEKLQEMLRTSKRPKEMARELFLFYYRFLQEDQVYPRMLFLVMAELDDPEVKKVFVGGLKKTAKLVQRSLKQAQDYGLVERKLNVEVSSWLMLGAYQMLALMKEAGILTEMSEKEFAAVIDSVPEAFSPSTK